MMPYNGTSEVKSQWVSFLLFKGGSCEPWPRREEALISHRFSGPLSCLSTLQTAASGCRAKQQVFYVLRMFKEQALYPPIFSLTQHFYDVPLGNLNDSSHIRKEKNSRNAVTGEKVPTAANNSTTRLRNASVSQADSPSGPNTRRSQAWVRPLGTNTSAGDTLGGEGLSPGWQVLASPSCTPGILLIHFCTKHFQNYCPGDTS